MTGARSYVRRSVQVLTPGVPTAALYLVLVVAAVLSMTGLARFQVVQLVSYLLVAPWYALGWLAEPADHVLSLASLLWTLAIWALTLVYLYVLAAVMVAVARRVDRQRGATRDR